MLSGMMESIFSFVFTARSYSPHSANLNAADGEAGKNFAIFFKIGIAFLQSFLS